MKVEGEAEGRRGDGSPPHCQEQIHYTVDPVGEGVAVGSFYCILKQQLQSQERRLRDEEEEGRRKDNRIGYLENTLIRHNISFGSEFSGVA